MNADQKMKARMRVTIAEIVTTFCSLDETPRGRVPTPETIDLVRRKVAEARMRGLLTGPEGE
jgi:hypothetical protein